MRKIDDMPEVRAARQRALTCQIRLNELRTEERELRDRCGRAREAGSVPTHLAALVDDGADGATIVLDDRADARRRLQSVREAMGLQEELVTEARAEQASEETKAYFSLVREQQPNIRKTAQQVADSLRKLFEACAKHRQLAADLEAAGVSLGALGASEWAPLLCHLGEWTEKQQSFDLANRWLSEVVESGIAD